MSGYREPTGPLAGPAGMRFSCVRRVSVPREVYLHHKLSLHRRAGRHRGGSFVCFLVVRVCLKQIGYLSGGEASPLSRDSFPSSSLAATSVACPLVGARGSTVLSFLPTVSYSLGLLFVVFGLSCSWIPLLFLLVSEVCLRSCLRRPHRKVFHSRTSFLLSSFVSVYKQPSSPIRTCLYT